MFQRFKSPRWLAAFVVVATFVVMADSCGNKSSNPPSSMCAFIIGDGTNGHDTRVHKIVWPNENIHFDHNSENVRYIPCNSRNYLINDGRNVDANGHKVGDRFSLTLAYTSTHTPVYIWSSAYWTPNEDEAALRKFYDLCFKYTCSTDTPESGSANFSTRGWNGMLGENFGTSIDRAALDAAVNESDAIWQQHDPKLYDDLGKRMSQIFDDVVRQKTGYDLNLFCGSGNSEFQDPDHHKDFHCSNVRIVIDRVEPVDSTLAKQSADNLQAVQKQSADDLRVTQAKKLYGDNWAYWLGLQDTCAKTQACTFYIGAPPNSTPPVK